jgi:hypothetical protein
MPFAVKKEVAVLQKILVRPRPPLKEQLSEVHRTTSISVMFTASEAQQLSVESEVEVSKKETTAYRRPLVVVVRLISRHVDGRIDPSDLQERDSGFRCGSPGSI